MSGNNLKLFWAQRYEDGTYHARIIDNDTGLVSGVRFGDTLESAMDKAGNCGHWFVTEWRDEVPDGEQYRLINALESEDA